MNLNDSIWRFRLMLFPSCLCFHRMHNATETLCCLRLFWKRRLLVLLLLIMMHLRLLLLLLQLLLLLLLLLRVLLFINHTRGLLLLWRELQGLRLILELIPLLLHIRIIVLLLRSKWSTAWWTFALSGSYWGCFYCRLLFYFLYCLKLFLYLIVRLRIDTRGSVDSGWRVWSLILLYVLCVIGRVRRRRGVVLTWVTDWLLMIFILLLGYNPIIWWFSW